MNLSADRIPGLCILLCGALLALGAKPLCRKERNVTQVKMLGVGMAFIGAILIFLP